MECPSDIAELLDNARRTFLFSAYSVHVERHGAFYASVGGEESYWPGAHKADAETLFDIGSITKVACTASLFARMVDRGDLDLESCVSEFLPEFKESRVGNLSVRSLLSHSSGLRGWLPYYREAKKLVRGWVLEKSDALFEAEAGDRAIYSDIGFWLLGLIAESRLGPIETAFRKEVANVLHMHSARFLPKKGRFVSTEFCLDRKRLLQGEVFDENCAAMGGIGAHAGLFATASDLAALARTWLAALEGKSDWISQSTAKLFTSRSHQASGSSWALGWDTKSEVGSTAGSLLSSDSFGILGYPGCSLWIDPLRDAFIIFLSNRIHPSRYNERIRAFRPALHDRIAHHWS